MSILGYVGIIAGILGIVIALCVIFARTKHDDGEHDISSSPLPHVEQERPRAVADERGAIGEQLVMRELGQNIIGERYIVNGITARIDNNTFDIDHVCINKYGVWVIETKNYSGVICGSETDKNWTRTVKGETSTRRNPIMQNETHIRRLSKWLNIDKSIFRNIVVFTGNADLHVYSDCVCKLRSLTACINSGSVVLYAGMMEKLYKKLLQLKDEYAVSKSEHMQSINEHALQYCPICGAELTISYGDSGTRRVCTNSRCSYECKIDDF